MPLTLIIEGANGVGKTTFIKALRKNLKGVKVRNLSFPSPSYQKISDTPEGRVLSYIADFERVMAKELDRDLSEVYIIDRGFVSTAVYKGGGIDSATLRIGGSALLKLGGTVLIVHIKCDPHVAAGRLLGRKVEVAKDAFGGVHNPKQVTQEQLGRELSRDIERFGEVCRAACSLDLDIRCMLAQPVQMMEIDSTDGEVDKSARRVAKGIRNYLAR